MKRKEKACRLSSLIIRLEAKKSFFKRDFFAQIQQSLRIKHIYHEQKQALLPKVFIQQLLR